MEKTPKYCECQGPNYQGCLTIPNGLYACYTKSGEIDHKKGCLGKKRKGIDGVSGWTRGCKALTYTDLKERMTKWCDKLLQEGVYDSEQYQSCLKNLEIGTIGSSSYYDDNEDLDQGKEMKHIYGYYQRGRDKINPVNPTKKFVKDDFQKMLVQHGKTHLFLVANGKGELFLSANPDKFDERDWQIVDLGQDQNYALRSHYSRYLIGNDTGTVQANRDQLSPWAQWKLEKHNHQYAFFSVVHKKYLTIYNDQPVLRDGWNDSNLWNLSKKTKTTGGFLGDFDQGPLTLEKDNLLSDLTKYNTNRVEYQTKVLILKNKIGDLGSLRDDQRKFMVRMADNASDRLEKRKELYQNYADKLKDRLKTKLAQHDLAVKKAKMHILSGRPNAYSDQLKRMAILTKHKTKSLGVNKMIIRFENQIDDIENYKIEIGDHFTVIKEKEREELGSLIAKNTKISNQWRAKATEQVSSIKKWIKNVADQNRALEGQINGLRSEISIQLEDINNIGINIETGKTEKTEFRARGEINDEIREYQLSDLKYQFYGCLLLILLAGFLSAYITYLSFKRITIPS